jgi:hypothetical protein
MIRVSCTSYLMRRMVVRSCSSLCSFRWTNPTKLRDPFTPSGLKGYVGGSGNRQCQKHLHHRMGPQAHARGNYLDSRKGVWMVSGNKCRRNIGHCFDLSRQWLVFFWYLWSVWNLFNVDSVDMIGRFSLLARQTTYVPNVRSQIRTLGNVQHTPNISTP